MALIRSSPAVSSNALDGFSAPFDVWRAGRVGEWQALGKEVYVYFNNDGAGNAIRNAERLRELVGA